MTTRFEKGDKTVHALFIANILIITIFSLTGCGGDADIPAASVLSSGRVNLSWTNFPDAASYDLYISTSPGITALNSYKISAVTTPIAITDLEPGTTYYFIVAVHDVSGETRRSKEVSYTVADTEEWIDLGDLKVESVATDKFTLPATAASMASSPPAQNTASKALESTGKASQNFSKKSATAATPKTSLKAAQKPAPAASQKPPAVVAKKTSQAVQTNKANRRDVTLAWDHVPGASTYNLYWSDKPGVTRRNGVKIKNAENPYKFKDLTKGKKYYFVVTAVNASGESKESEEFSFTVEQ